jgi:hypothetical protein
MREDDVKLCRHTAPEHVKRCSIQPDAAGDVKSVKSRPPAGERAMVPHVAFSPIQRTKRTPAKSLTRLAVALVPELWSFLEVPQRHAASPLALLSSPHLPSRTSSAAELLHAVASLRPYISCSFVIPSIFGSLAAETQSRIHFRPTMPVSDAISQLLLTYTPAFNTSECS